MKSRNQIVQPHGTSIAKTLDSYRLIFDQDVKVRAFERERLVERDIVADFLDWSKLPIPFDELPKVNSNESVSAEGMAVLHELSPSESPRNKEETLLKRKRLDAVFQADQAIDFPTKPNLRPEVVEYITSQCKELPLLRDKYGLEFDDIDYGIAQPRSGQALQITRIDQLCAYNSERKEAVLQLAKAKFDQSIGHKDKRHWSNKTKAVLGKLQSLLR